MLARLLAQVCALLDVRGADRRLVQGEIRGGGHAVRQIELHADRTTDVDDASNDEEVNRREEAELDESASAPIAPPAAPSNARSL